MGVEEVEAITAAEEAGIIIATSLVEVEVLAIRAGAPVVLRRLLALRLPALAQSRPLGPPPPAM